MNIDICYRDCKFKTFSDKVNEYAEYFAGSRLPLLHRRQRILRLDDSADKAFHRHTALLHKTDDSAEILRSGIARAADVQFLLHEQAGLE